MSSLSKKQYKFYDTFIKSCEYVDGKGECKTSRESKKCVDNKCERVVIPRDKKEILKDFYNQNKLKEDEKLDGEYEQWFNSYHLKQDGAGMDPELKKILVGNISKKYKCPFCKAYKYKESFLAHTDKHVNKTDLKKVRFKKPDGDKVNKVKIYGKVEKMKAKTNEILKKYIEDKNVHNQTGGANENLTRFSVDDIEEGNILQGPENIEVQTGCGKGDIRIKIPQNVRKSAFYAFKLKERGFKGGNIVGWNMAKQLITKNYISIEDLRYMRNWFSRHLKISYPIYKKWLDFGRQKNCNWYDKKSIILWLIWGGNSGFNWVNNDTNLKLLNDHFNKSYEKLEL